MNRIRRPIGWHHTQHRLCEGTFALGPNDRITYDDANIEGLCGTFPIDHKFGQSWSNVFPSQQDINGVKEINTHNLSIIQLNNELQGSPIRFATNPTPFTSYELMCIMHSKYLVVLFLFIKCWNQVRGSQGHHHIFLAYDLHVARSQFSKTETKLGGHYSTIICREIDLKPVQIHEEHERYLQGRECQL